MDGVTALKYVRSRHALGPEGSDFARSKRQEKVISAFKDKVFSLGTFLNPLKIVNLANVFEDSIDTDVKQEEYDDFIKLARKLEDAEMRSVVLDVGDSTTERAGLLEYPNTRAPYRGQWVIIPRAGSNNFSEIQAFIECEITAGECVVTPTKRPTAPIE